MQSINDEHYNKLKIYIKEYIIIFLISKYISKSIK
jgi:hypothetical protein